MRYSKLTAWALAAAGLVLSGTAAKAENPYWEARDIYHDRQDLRRDNRDLRHDYVQRENLRDDIAYDQWRLNQAIRSGNDRAAAAQAADLARDQRHLKNLQRDIRHDQADRYWDRRDLDRDYRRFDRDWR
jgi:hypothetical protein